LNKHDLGFCFYSGSSALYTRLKTDVNDDRNWISSGELKRILASTEYQDCPRTYFVISKVQLPHYFQTLGSKWLYIYYSDDEVNFDQLRNQFIHDVAQHYRKTAQRVLREENDGTTAKLFLIKSTRLYELLEKDADEIMKRFAKMPPFMSANN
jgi:hypothetical protein